MGRACYPTRGTEPCKRVFAAVVGGRQKGRPKLRWEGVAGYAKKLERHWRSAARNRDGWQKFLRKALAQSGLLCQWLLSTMPYHRPLKCTCPLHSVVTRAAVINWKLFHSRHILFYSELKCHYHITARPSVGLCLLVQQKSFMTTGGRQIFYCDSY